MLTPINRQSRTPGIFRRSLVIARLSLYDRLAPEIKLHLALVLFSSNITVVVQRGLARYVNQTK